MSKSSQLTVSEAAQRVGVSRQTIFKAIKQGKLSATLSHDGVKQVNVAELLRVYGRLLSPDEVTQNQVNKKRQSTSEVATATLQLELERAKFVIAQREFELEQLRSRMEEMRERERATNEEKLRLFGIVERQTLLLNAPVKPTSKAAPATARSKPAQSPALASATQKKALVKASPTKSAKPATKVAIKKVPRK